jgi:hypothetical protein
LTEEISMADRETGPDLGGALAALFTELIDGPPAREAYMLNQGDEGLLRSVERIDWRAANQGVAGGGASIAQHVEHVRFGISLMNRWKGGEENPFAGADWRHAWTTEVGSDAEWAELRAALADEVRTWQASLGSVGRAADLPRMALLGIIGSVAHLAYHMGAIRQIDRATRGPTDEESRA